MVNILLPLHMTVNSWGVWRSCLPNIWKARAEPKCKFLAWVLLHGKVPTAENLAKRNWPCNDVCPLCYCINETTTHLFTQCNFTETLWHKVADRFQLPDYHLLCAQDGPVQWVNRIIRPCNATEKKRRLEILFTTWWQIWKERNRRTFEHKEQSVNSVFELTKSQLCMLDLVLTSDTHV